MKTKILFLLLAWVPMSVTIAQEPNDYRPFIEEGKVWLVGDFPRGRQMPDALLTYYFDGDTIVGEHLCKRWMLDVRTSDSGYIHHSIWGSRVSLLAPIFEENKKVWFFREGEEEPRLLYDFSGVVSEDGFSVGCFEEDYDTNCYIDYAGVDSIHNSHNSLRFVSAHDDFMLADMSPEVREWFEVNKGDCGGSWTTLGYRWYEGIGTIFAPDLNVPHRRGEYREILCVYEGEQIIYEHPRASEILDAIQDIPTQQIVNGKSSNGKCYDLSGRRIGNNPLPRGIYIKDGRKVVVK